MRRREFITLLGGAAAGWPLVARGQQAALPLIGYLHSASPKPNAHLVAAFRQGLKESGFAEGQNVVIEYRWADGRYERLPALVADLVSRQAAVIVAQGGTVSIRAASAATATIPIVFSTGGDPVKEGLVASFNRPGGNVTGVSLLTTGLGAKRLEVLREVVPKAAVIAVLLNPNNPSAELQLREMQQAAGTLGQQIRILNANTERELDTAFASRIDALAVGADAFFSSRRERLVALTAHHAVPAIYEWREFPQAGGLMSYGTALADGYHQVGVYTARILKGEKPANLPVQQSVKVELVINTKTAKALGLSFPLSLLGRADEVIE